MLNASTVQVKTKSLPKKGQGLRKEKMMKETEIFYLLLDSSATT